MTRGLGNFLDRGMIENGVEAYEAKDYERALSFFREAANKNHMKAYRYLGLCYEHGYGVKKDIKQAFAYYQKAAELGDVTGTALLGHMYEDGLGTKVDYDKAMELYQKASVRSDHVGGLGKIGIGHLYEYGHGVEQNAAEARVWYEKALASGDTDAQNDIDRLDAAFAAPKKAPTEPRILTKRLNAGTSADIVNGVTSIDTSKIWQPVQAIDFSAKHDVMIRNSDGSLVPMDEPYFESEQIAPNTWKIRSDGDYCYLLAGDEIGVMIDSGYGAGNLRTYAESLCGKPVKYVINTHYHFDHTANDAYFDAAFMTPVSVNYATIPYNSFAGLSFPRDYPVVTVQDGYKLNLGNRELTIIEFPHANHTLGGLAVLDPTRRILFTGDEFLLPNRADLIISLEDFADNMKRVEKVRSDFDVMYSGTGLKDGSIFDTYYQAALYGISKDFQTDGTAAPTMKQQKPAVSDTDTGSSATIYERGRVRPGDATENAPEKIPQGTRQTFTYNGFPVSYVEQDKQDSINQ
ncbi:MAG: MBL fold metallo-hydrolase [Mitsuokella sp.]|uniref:MBL fold metallo-hydrolase n=1 Tax=Mitsuokella sp. TaxID=2049034 RepID=UPI003F0764B9